MSGELINATAIQYVADKIGMAVSQVYQAYVSVQAGYGILTIICYIVFPALWVSVVWYFVNKNKKEYEAKMKKYEEDEDYRYSREPEDKSFDAWAMGLGIGLIVALFGALIVFKIGESIMQIYYPQFFAIQSMIGLISGV